jgi:hypothetical protein
MYATARSQQNGKSGSAAITAEAPARLTTTLYDVITTLQTVAAPDADDLVVPVVMHWLRSRRLTRLPVRRQAARARALVG